MTGTVDRVTPGPGPGGVHQVVVRASRGISCVVGDSIAIDGCCLTVTDASDVQSGRLVFDASGETMLLTTLGTKKSGDLVNLERALRVGDRLGGHFVSGHVDGRARVVALQDLGGGTMGFDVALPGGEAGFVVKKGSICLDGVSLTVNKVIKNSELEIEVGVTLIPHTLAATTLHRLKSGDLVNYETDMLAKYARAGIPTTQT